MSVPSRRGKAAQESQPSPESSQHETTPKESRGRVPWWWPLVPQVVGLLGVVYEIIFDKLDRPWIMVSCTTLAVGGKLADAAREILRN